MRSGPSSDTAANPGLVPGFVRFPGHGQWLADTLKSMAAPATHRDHGTGRPATVRGGRPRGRVVLEIGAVVVVTLLAVGLLGSVLGRPARAGRTMEPLIGEGARVWLVQPTVPQRGDIVVIVPDTRWNGVVADDPSTLTRGLRWLRLDHPPADSRMMVRVIAVPGDEVRCCDSGGSLLVNGHPVPAWVPGVQFRVRVPEGRYFVASESPSAASSACYLSSLGIEAMVTAEQIESRVARVGWPWAAVDISTSRQAWAAIPRRPATADPIIEAGKDPSC